jgi:hypothetical protein
MKLDPLFKSQNNKLYTLAGDEVPLGGSRFVKETDCSASTAEKMIEEYGTGMFFVKVMWSVVGKDEDNYNEEFLASLRDWLKVLEDKKRFAVIVPVADIWRSEADCEALAASMKHCARRIKDCVSVVGFAIPEVACDRTVAAHFMDVLSEKHEQYIFFSKDKEILADSKVVQY